MHSLFIPSRRKLILSHFLLLRIRLRYANKAFPNNLYAFFLPSPLHQIPNTTVCSHACTHAQLLLDQTLRKFDQNATQSASRTSNSAIFSITGILASSESNRESIATNLESTASNREIVSFLRFSISFFVSFRKLQLK